MAANGAAPDSAADAAVAGNAWSAPGPAAFDLRSDVVTTPTAAMLSAIASTTLLDDVFREDPTTAELEAMVAALAGKEAGLLVLSGTMGNQVAFRTHLTAPPHGFLTDKRSHTMVYEAGGVATLSGALAQAVTPANGHHLTLAADIQPNAVLSDDVHACPTRLIALENTLNGTVLPLAECRAIAAWARAQDPPLALHLDGARLWEAVAAGAGTLQEFSACFDSVSLCFSKGLGAPIGSVLVGSEAFVRRARRVRKALGGGLRQAGVVAAPARVAVEQTFLSGALARTHVRARAVAAAWEERGGRLAYPVETNMAWLDLKAAGVGEDEFAARAARRGLRVGGGRLVVHYQVGDEAVARLEGLFDDVLGVGEGVGRSAKGAPNGVAGLQGGRQ